MKFIHFGCWNEGYCNTTNTNINGLSATMNLLRETVKIAYEKNDRYEFISVAGDNYYATQVKEPVEHAVFDKTNFDSGFNCLPKDIKKIIILGNHEIEKNVEFDGSVVNCGSLIKQVELSLIDPSIKYFNDMMCIYKNNTLILFIDTTIYTMKEQKINESCYKTLDIEGGVTYKVFKKSSIDENESIDELVKYMNSRIEESINEFTTNKKGDFKNLIIIGHAPIYAMKTKINKTGEKINKVYSIQKFISFFNTNLIPVLSKNNIKTYYLCADTHIYQKGNIIFDNLDYKVEQYIVGTGGAHQDMISEKLHESKENADNMLEYNIVEQSNKFGFITVDIVDGNVNILYNSVSILILNGRGVKIDVNQDILFYNKYMKYKQKYINLKKN